MRSLSDTSHEHHDRIVPHVERLLELADTVGQGDLARYRSRFEEEYLFVTGRIVPHMEAIETALYGRLELLMEKRHSMAPMREEHQELRRLIEALGRYRELLATDRLGTAEGIGLRRTLYRLHAILKVHLAEEELYLRVLDHNLSDTEKDVLARAIDHACDEPL